MAHTTYLTDRQVADRYGVARTTPWRWVQLGRFPHPIRISPGCVRWRLSDLEAHESAAAAKAQTTRASR